MDNFIQCWILVYTQIQHVGLNKLYSSYTCILSVPSSRMSWLSIQQCQASVVVLYNTYILSVQSSRMSWLFIQQCQVSVVVQYNSVHEQHPINTYTVQLVTAIQLLKRLCSFFTCNYSRVDSDSVIPKSLFLPRGLGLPPLQRSKCQTIERSDKFQRLENQPTFLTLVCVSRFCCR